MSEEEKEEEAEEEAKSVRAAVTPVIKRREAKAARPVRRVAEPVKEMPKKPSPRTVKGKIAAIQKAAGRIYSGARAIQSDAAKRMKENQEFAAAVESDVKRIQTDIKSKTEVFQKVVADIYAGVRAVQSAIGEQVKENLEAVAAIQSGINKLQSGISEQMRENQVYVRDFYG